MTGTDIWLCVFGIFGIISLIAFAGLIFVFLRKKCDKIDNIRIQPLYCQPPEEIISWLSQHGPYIEACAGRGWLAQELSSRGVECVSFDKFQNDGLYYDVIQADNGTFEDRYPNHTLIICHGRNVLASIRNFTGNKVITCGYQRLIFDWHPDGQRKGYRFGSDYLPQEFDFRPSPECMDEHGFECVETKTFSTHPEINHMIKLYVRRTV